MQHIISINIHVFERTLGMCDNFLANWRRKRLKEYSYILQVLRCGLSSFVNELAFLLYLLV